MCVRFVWSLIGFLAEVGMRIERHYASWWWSEGSRERKRDDTGVGDGSGDEKREA
jgi:hypothetical protein